MSNVSQSSIDFGLQRTSSSTIDNSPKDISRIAHPTRLQHSPSLPNIWFPPHSGPIPREMSTAEKEPNYGPSAPPSPNPNPPVSLKDKEQQTRHVKYASIDPAYRKPSGPKTHARRRTERDQPHSLLTPPLTPSSSIRTNASTDYAASTTAQPGSDLAGNITEDIVDPDPDTTHILLLENVKRSINVASLEKAIFETFEKARSERNLNISFDSNYDASHARELLKGMNQRLHAPEGKVFVVFFDARVTKVIRDILIDKDAATSSLEDCVDELTGEDGSPRWLSVQLTTLEEIYQILGHSEFLSDLDSSFWISVQKVKHTDEAADSTSSGDHAHVISESNEPKSKSNAEETGNSQSGIDVAIVQNLLKSFGNIRCFRFSRQEVDQEGSSAFVYYVEYYDVRDCDTAWLDLDNKTVFGLSMKVSGKKLKPKPLSEQVPVSDTIEPFPNVFTAGESFNGLRISAPGFQSQVRQRFVPGQEVPQEFHRGYDIATQSTPIQASPITGAGTSSPSVFYITSFVDIPNHASQTAYPPQDHPGVQGPPDAGAQRPAPTPVIEQPWDNDTIYRSGAISPCYNHDGICSYCPSRRALPGVAYNMGFSHYGLSPSPAPSMYYPPHIQATPQLVPLQSLPPSWGYDPTMAAVGPGGPAALISMGGMNPGPPSPAPFFLREDGSSHGRSTAQHPSYERYPLASRPPTFHPMQVQSTVSEPEQTLALQDVNSYPQLAHTVSNVSESSPASHHSATLGTADLSETGNAHSGGTGHDRNMLNLHKIRKGGDTRTTVMIKNIPNKMSDADLTTYISKVCPRRIDFLYLRMDFKNGCNVGYAFVNFITVEDLLQFANARLGAKWNMFSSEKVLQMSYANYQGKEALVEKFKNSAIMDEREAWRPRIFYSSGPQQGLPEPFPTPTHIRRKERSSYNRGTLFPPGMNGHAGHRRQHDDPRLQQDGHSAFNERYSSSSHSFHNNRNPVEEGCGAASDSTTFRHANYRAHR